MIKHVLQQVTATRYSQPKEKVVLPLQRVLLEESTCALSCAMYVPSKNGALKECFSMDSCPATNETTKAAVNIL